MASKKKVSAVVGVFEDRSQADKAVNELKAAGFRDDQIGVAMRNAEGTAHYVEEGTEAEEGAVAGALAGLGLGALAGLGVLAGVIPVVGPAIAAGTLGIVLSNAAAGAGIAGLVGALIGYGIPENEAEFYEGEFKAGRTIVTVQANGHAAEASAILRSNYGYDINTQGATAETTAGEVLVADAVETPVAKTRTSNGVKTREGDTIEVKEERLHAEKHPVETGQVRVRKEVHTEVKTLEVPVEREEVVIERTPVRGRATAASVTADDLREGEEIRIPVREEEVRVTKDAVVTEEVKVGKRVVHDTKHVAGEVRKEEVVVEQEGNVKVRGKK